MDIKEIKEKCLKLLNLEISSLCVCLLLSAYTLVAFHFPFFSYVIENAGSRFNEILLGVSFAIVMLALNFIVYSLLLYLFRVVGKLIIAITLIGNGICLYFVNTFNALIDRSMMGNVLNTQASEATSFLSWGMLLYAVILGVVPSILLLVRPIKYEKVGKYFRNIGITLVVILAVVGCNYKNVIWIDKHAPVIGSKLMPWSYIVNSVRYWNYEKKINQKEIILPDAEKVSDTKDVCILIIGESARSKNFSLYGYERNTNPLMSSDSVVALKAKAAHTNTIEAVKAILQHRPVDGKLYEILPNYLYRNGVDVEWRRSNWGTPPLHVEKQYTKGDLKKLYPEADEKFDGILFHGLKERIENSDSSKIFIGLHTYTSHGPEYYSNTPDSLKIFMPECRTVNMAEAKQPELINAYDNTIIYTDMLVHSLIEMLKEIPNRRSCVMFVSDHGESLGEGGLYMHGVPMSMAPDVQVDIPFIVWTSDNSGLKVKDIDVAGHDNVYHSVLKFLGIETSFFDESKNIFE